MKNILIGIIIILIGFCGNCYYNNYNPFQDKVAPGMVFIDKSDLSNPYENDIFTFKILETSNDWALVEVYWYGSIITNSMKLDSVMCFSRIK